MFALAPLAFAWPWYAKPGMKNIGHGSASGYDPKYVGAAWESQDATTKFRILGQAVGENTAPLPWYGAAREVELFTEDLVTTFSHVADDMPLQFLGLEERPKLIHTVGAIAPGALVITDQSLGYTGLFASGSETMFVRFSSATQPTPTADPPVVTPGVSLKFLRSGVPSANMFCMYSLVGQQSFNFFAHDLTNHAPNFNSSLAPTTVALLAAAFTEVSPLPTMIGLSDMAAYDTAGNKAQPVFPWRLVLHPTNETHGLFPDEPPASGDVNYYLQQFATIPAGTRLYDVYAQLEPASADADFKLRKIGYVESRGAFTASTFGDRDMFFKHTYMTDDFVYRPDWRDGTFAAANYQASLPYIYTYADLPF